MLTGPEQLEWIGALCNAFSYAEFTALLFHRLNDRIDNYAPPVAAFRYAVGDVVDAYSRRDSEGQLIATAIEARPNNAALLVIASGKKAAAAPELGNLERLIRQSNSLLDFSAWLTRAGKLQVCVCRIEILAQGGGLIFGTGFLISRDLVMTNYHVVECIAAVEDSDATYGGPKAAAKDLVCRFDYKVLDNGVTNLGTKFRLAPNWRVAVSPNDELDCAVIRLSEPAGTLSVGDNPNAPGDPRGWIDLPSKGTVPDFKEHSPLFIIQHPEGDPLKLALDSDAIQSVNANRTRIRYSTNTKAGSSGSPCFDQDWNLIALHHSGDPNFKAQYNEGVPMDSIVNYLANQKVI